MKKVLLMLLLSLAACGASYKEYVVQGTVRNVWCHDGINGRYCDITFEHDADLSYTVIEVAGNPPVWKDEHVVMRVQDTGEWLDHFVSVRRLP